jgi:hypothetical protein
MSRIRAAGVSEGGIQKVDLRHERGQAGREGKVEGRGGQAGGEGGKRKRVENLKDGEGQVDKRNKGGGRADELKSFPAGKEGKGSFGPKRRVVEKRNLAGNSFAGRGKDRAEPGKRVGRDAEEGIAEGKNVSGLGAAN